MSFDDEREEFETVPRLDPHQVMRELLLKWWRGVEIVRDEEERL